MKPLYTERRGQVKPRVTEALTPEIAKALIGMIDARIDEQWFGQHFPAECEDGGQNAGCDQSKLKNGLAAFDLIWPADWRSATETPEDGQVFDLIEFAYEHIAFPESYQFHSYWRHDHYNYDQDKGRQKFEEEINRVFARHGMAFELKQGEITRMAPTGLQEALAQTVFQTGDSELDRLLETAREKFLNRSLDVRKEGLEKLWDAWERLKTVEPGKDKKAQVTALLDRAAAEANFRALLETEATTLTKTGNDFMIRHTETTKTPVGDSSHVDYLFHRMFSLIRLLLKSTNRGG